jgi:bacterioferritin B
VLLLVPDVSFRCSKHFVRARSRRGPSASEVFFSGAAIETRPSPTRRALSQRFDIGDEKDGVHLASQRLQFVCEALPTVPCQRVTSRSANRQSTCLATISLTTAGFGEATSTSGNDPKPPAGNVTPVVSRLQSCNLRRSGRHFCVVASQKIIDAINEQIGNEFGAMLQYYAIAAHFGAEALPELSAHFYGQAEEEKQHALRFIQFVIDTGGRVKIPATSAPQAHFKVAEEAVNLSLEQESSVTSQINALVAMAKAESDYTTENFLQWFVKEQLEEVASMDQLLRVVQRAGEGNLLRVEEYLAREKSRGQTSDKLRENS